MHVFQPLRPSTALHALRGLTFAVAIALSGCGGGGDSSGLPDTGTGTVTPAAPTVEIKGLAATGAAIANATVTAVNKNGTKATATTGTGGSYILNIAEGGPYLLSVTDSAGRTWYSYAPAAGTANLTPLTTLALLQANGNQPLTTLVSNWNSRTLTDAQVLDAARVVNANLAGVMQGKGVAAASTNVFTASFAANGSGLDAVLDAMRVTIACSASSCTQTINNPNGSLLITWNASIATNGYSFSWTGGGTSGTVDVGIGSCRAPKAGTFSLVVQTSVSGVGGLTVPEVCIDGLPGKPATQSEFCGDATVRQQLPPNVQLLSCSYSGNTGTIAARITSPLVIDYSVTYTFVQR